MCAVRTKDIIARDLVREASAARDLIAALQSDDEVLNTDMVEGETSLFEAIEAALSEIDECDVMVSGLATKIGEFSDRKRRVDARIEKLRGLMEQAMVVGGLPTVKLATATVTVKEVAAKGIITDEAAIPAEFWKQPDPVLDRAAIQRAFKDGVAIPGVVASNKSTSIQIRRA